MPIGDQTVDACLMDSKEVEFGVQDGVAIPAGTPAILGAGTDGGGVARTRRTDSSGRSVTVGAAAVGAAPAGDPVLQGGSDGAVVRVIKLDTPGRQDTFDSTTGTLANGAETAVSNVAVSVLAANANRKVAIVQNVGNLTARIGVAGVTAATGIQLVAGATLVLEPPYVVTGAIFAIRETADTTVFATEIT